jgi:hypothetical protein
MKLRAAQLDSAGTFALPSGGGQAVQPLRTQLT